MQDLVSRWGRVSAGTTGSCEERGLRRPGGMGANGFRALSTAMAAGGWARVLWQ